MKIENAFQNNYCFANKFLPVGMRKACRNVFQCNLQFRHPLEALTDKEIWNYNNQKDLFEIVRVLGPFVDKLAIQRKSKNDRLPHKPKRDTLI
jgi:hypothetical protein